MEVDRNNFKDYYDIIKHIVDDSDFIAIDTELTGLHIKPLNYFDSPELRYKSLRDKSMQYAITQFGISAFKVMPGAEYVSYAPINFYVLPHHKSEKDNFAVNTETISFLNSSNFDYNRSWRDGIPTMRFSEFKHLMDLEKQKMDHAINSLVLNKIDICDFSQMTGLINECLSFLKNTDETELTPLIDLSDVESYLIKEHLATKIGCINGNWIFPISEYSKVLKKKVIRITKCDNYIEMKKLAITEQYMKRKEEFEEKVKFSDLIKYIGATGKFIIGHNCLLDCLHMYDNFIGPLSQEYKEFKRALHAHFPNFVDTKYLIAESKHEIFKNLQNTSLQSCYQVSNKLTHNPIYKQWDNKYEFQGKNMFHTAHYDAMITGKLFLNLITEIGGLDLNIDFRSELVKALSNYNKKFNVVYAEIKFINLNPSFVEWNDERKQVFHMAVPNYWQMSDIYPYLTELLKEPLKLICEGFRYKWIDDGSLMFKAPHEITVPLGTNDFVTITPLDQHHDNGIDNTEMEANGFTMAKSTKRRRTKN